MKFVVIAAKRTGSSHFVNLLSAHPDLLCHGNVFKDNTAPPMLWPPSVRPGADAEKKIRNELRDLRARAPNEFLEKVFSTGHGRPYVGFKIFWNQNNKILDALLDDRDVRKVVLFRTNVLANYASARAAAATGAWNLNSDVERPSAEKVAFNENDFIKFRDKYIGFYRRVFVALAEKREQYHLITYDQINDPTLFGAVINFIGADPNKPISQEEQPRKQVKQGPSDILSRFTNPAAAREFLSRRGVLHWAQEGETSLEYLSEVVPEDDNAEED